MYTYIFYEVHMHIYNMIFAARYCTTRELTAELRFTALRRDTARRLESGCNPNICTYISSIT